MEIGVIIIRLLLKMHKDIILEKQSQIKLGKIMSIKKGVAG